MKYKELIEANGLNLHGDIELFANFVAAQEREECAKVCEEDGLLWGQRYAAAIRARGKT